MPRPSQRVAHRLLRRARQLRVVVSVGTYTLLAPVGYAFFALAALALAGDPRHRARRLQWISCRAYRLLHAWMRWTRIAHSRPDLALRGLPPGPCVIVANHPTLIDVSAVMAALGSGFTVVKPALFRRRMLRPLLEGAGHIEGPGGDPVGAARVVERAVERLRQGVPLVIFPEGTRSVGGRMLPFGRAAFEVACRARVPVVSIGIRCEPVWLSKEVPLFDPPHPMPRLTLATLAIDDPARVDYDSRRLRRMVEDRIRRWHADGRPPGPSGPPTSVAAKDRPWPTPSKTA